MSPALSICVLFFLFMQSVNGAQSLNINPVSCVFATDIVSFNKYTSITIIT